MVEIKPFKALRPVTEFISTVSSPPYDVVNQNEAADIIQRNPNSFLKVIKPEATISLAEKLVYHKLAARAARNLKNMIDRKIMILEQEPCFYIYQQKHGSYHRTGIVTCLLTEDYRRGIIKIHEKIRIKTWKERVQHIRITRAHTGCALMIYETNSYIEELVNQGMVSQNAIYDFVSDDGIRNCCWKISQRDLIASLKNAFREIQSLYIADGHHRVAAAVEVAQVERQEQKTTNNSSDEYVYFPALLIPHYQIRILGYHRLVKNLIRFSPDCFLQKLATKVKIEKIISNEPFLPIKKHEFGMNMDGQWYKLLAKENHILLNMNIIDQLDVSILQNQVLDPLLSIKDPQKSEKIEFIGGNNALLQLNNKIQQGARIAFTFYPTSVEEVMKVSDNKEVMPPKSTWFEPKVRSGIFVHQF